MAAVFAHAASAARLPAPKLANPNRQPVNGFGYLVQWTNVTGAFIYELAEDTQSNFSSPGAVSYWPTASFENIPAKTDGAYYYRVRAWDDLPENGGVAGRWSNTITVNVLSDAAFEDLLSRKIYDYFTSATFSNGLTRDRVAVSGTVSDVCSIAASGYYLSALTVGSARGWIKKNAAANRAKTALNFFLNSTPNVNGFFYHFLRPDGTPSDEPFREVSSIDTAILVAGALQAGEYFGGDVKTLADELYRRVNWKWMFDPALNIMHQAWTEWGGIGGYYGSYSEGLLLYLLAIGSPTYPIPAAAFYSFDRPKGNYAGPDFIFTPGGQLFTYQYPHAWYDFRNITDELGVNWWQNSIEGARANQRFCVENASYGYSQYLWGITASDGPDISLNPYGYQAYGALPAYGYIHDGTIAPTAAGGSIAMVPDIALPALKYMYAVHGDQVWQDYGFVDSFQPATGWVDNYYITIDQGIILLMLENKRSATIWNAFMANAYVQRSLARTKFSGFSTPEVLLEDFEDQDLWTPDTTVGWWESDGTAVYQRSTVSDPVSEGAASMRLDYSKNGLPYSFTGAHLSAANPNRDFSGHELLTLDVFGSCNLLVKLRNEDLEEEDVATLWSKDPGGWNRLVFDFSNLGITTTQMDNILFFVEPGDVSSSGTVHFDRIRLESGSPLILETFEDFNFWTPDTTLGWWDSDGTAVYQRWQVKDPSHGGFGSMQVNYSKNGLPWSLFAGYLSELNPLRDFTQRTRLTLWARGNGEILVKLRDRQFNETEIGTALVNNPYVWKKLTFDYSGVDTINLSDIDNILFFIAPGSPDASGTLYLDDIAIE